MPERDSWATMNGSSRIVDAEDARLATGALWTPGSTGVSARQGIRPAAGDPFKVLALSPTPGANVTVNLGQMAITATRGFGSYIATLDAVKTVPILNVPADPSLQRNDIVIATQSDTYYGDGSTVYSVQRVQGVPGAGDPSLAAFPDHIPLARIRVTAGATTVTNAMIDDLRPGWTVALGGILPVADLAARPAAPYAGQAIYRLDKKFVEIHDGTAWRVADSCAPVGALADITNPVTGQTAILTTDNMLYRWSGSAWVAIMHTSPGAGQGLYQQANAQSFVSGTPTKIKFDAVPPYANSDVSASGVGTTDFTLNRAGLWEMSAQMVFVAGGVSAERFLSITDGANSVRYVSDNDITSAAVFLSCSTSRRLGAGSVVSVHATQSSGGPLSSAPVFQPIFITLTWKGP